MNVYSDKLCYMRGCIVCHSSIENEAAPLCEKCKKDPFRVEEARDIFARNRKFGKLKKTYNRSFCEIPNVNSPEFWDRLLCNNREREEKSPITEARISTVIKIVKNRTGRLLDVGLGYGFIEKNIPQGIFDLYGIDISRKAIERIKDVVKGDFKIGSVLRIPFKDEFFNVVLILEVLEHISPHDIFRALKELKRVLKKKGGLVVSVPLNERLEEMYEKGINPNGHIRVYTPELIRAELQISGFQIQKEVFLYAFRTFYWLKKFLQKTILQSRWKPNNIIIFAQKP